MCDNYKSHIYKTGKIYLCKGCVHTYLGLILFLIISTILISIPELNIDKFYSSIYALILMYLFLCCLIIDFLKIKIPRIVKNTFRQMLGYSIAIAIFIVIYSNIWIKIVSLITMIIIYISLRQTRKHKKHNKCISCPELLNNSSTCSGFNLIVDIETDFSKTAGNYLQKKYYEKRIN